MNTKGNNMKITYWIVILCFFCNLARGDLYFGNTAAVNSGVAGDSCDWSSIVKNTNGTYTYSKALHLCVGQLVEDNATKTQQIDDLTKAISMKDLALQASDQRATLWMTTSGTLENRLQTVDSLQQGSEKLMFGLGVLMTLGATFAAAKLIGK